MTRRAFNRYMIEIGAGTHPKFAGFTDGERCGHFLGVLAVARMSPISGRLLVGELPAQAKHVASAAGISTRTAASALKKLQQIGVLEHDPEHGCLRVHDWDDYQQEPKIDHTHAERQRRYIERQRNRPNDAVTDTVTDASVTPLEVEGRRGKKEGEGTSAVRTLTSPQEPTVSNDDSPPVPMPDHIRTQMKRIPNPWQDIRR